MCVCGRAVRCGQKKTGTIFFFITILTQTDMLYSYKCILCEFETYFQRKPIRPFPKSCKMSLEQTYGKILGLCDMDKKYISRFFDFFFDFDFNHDFDTNRHALSHILLVFAHLVLHFSLFYYTFYSLFLFLPNIYIYIYIY